MEKDLSSAPQLQEDETHDSASTSKQPSTSKGGGKGRPGCTRKTKVTKRQQRNRLVGDFSSRKRKADEPPLKAPPKKIAPRSDQQKKAPPHAKKRKDPPCQKPETRKPLQLQTCRPPNQKRVTIIQDMCNAVKDAPPSGEELELFWSKWIPGRGWTIVSLDH